MCGISCVIDRSGEADVARILRDLHAPIRHRGPDDEGFTHITASGEQPSNRARAVAGLAFRRLKVIDVSTASSQPMRADDAPVWIIFNGEIYNFRDLREILRARGHRFRSAGDTEVFLAAYREWGTDCFARLEGMWAAVIVDAMEGRIVGSRDRFGIKPLYWSLSGGLLLLASEIRQIVAARREKPRANAGRIAIHLRGSRDPVTEETFFEGIESVPPATWFSVPLSGGRSVAPRFTEYWRLRDFQADESMSYESASARFAGMFDAAIDRHRISDVGVGSLLSGGLDSAAVTASLAKLQKKDGLQLPTFSFGFRGDYRQYSELQYVDAMVGQAGLSNSQTSFDDRWVAANLRAVISSIEEPALALPALAQFRVFQLCRQKGMTVIFDGQGADEMLAGYPYHQRIAVTDDLRHGRFGRGVGELQTISTRTGRSRLALLGEYYGRPLWNRVRRTKKTWWQPSYGSDQPRSRPTDWSIDESALNRRLYHDVRWGNVKTILMYADRNAMQHSIEARVPFFDRELVELIFSLPARFKAGDGQRKRILRDYARTHGVPPAITERVDRMGFATPDQPLLLSPATKDVALNALTDAPFMRAPFVSRARLDSMIRGYRSGTYQGDYRSLFRAVSLSLWRDAFDVTF